MTGPDRRGGSGLTLGVVRGLGLGRRPGVVPGQGGPPRPQPPTNLTEPPSKAADAKLPPPVDLKSGGKPEPLVVNTPDTAAHPPILNGSGRPPPPEDPVVAKGRVVWPGGALPEDVDVTLYDV